MLNNKTITILLTGLIAGTLDIFTAIIYYGYILGKTTATSIFKHIGSAALDKNSFGIETMIAAGIFFHYLIAFTAAIVYFFSYPHIALLRKNILISGIIYGIIVWLVMNMIVLPLSRLHVTKWSLIPSLTGMLILIVMIGLPIAFLTKKYYDKHPSP